MQQSAPKAANYVAVDVASHESAPDVEAFLAQNQALSLAYAIDTNTRLISAYQVNQLSAAVVLAASAPRCSAVQSPAGRRSVTP